MHGRARRRGRAGTAGGAPATSRVRMSAAQRREQLIAIGRQLFAERGFDATSVEEVAARAKVSKPVVYEHFGGKEGLYAVVVDREVRSLLDRIAAALTAGHPRELLEQAALALLDYIEEEPHGFRVLVRESPVLSPAGNFSQRDERRGAPGRAHPGRRVQDAAGYDPKFAELYSQALVGHGGADRPVVAGGAQAEQGDGGRAPGQPRLERPVPPGGQADPADPRRRRAHEPTLAVEQAGDEQDQAERDQHDDVDHRDVEEVRVGLHERHDRPWRSRRGPSRGPG